MNKIELTPPRSRSDSLPELPHSPLMKAYKFRRQTDLRNIQLSKDTKLKERSFTKKGKYLPWAFPKRFGQQIEAVDVGEYPPFSSSEDDLESEGDEEYYSDDMKILPYPHRKDTKDYDIGLGLEARLRKRHAVIQASIMNLPFAAPFIISAIREWDDWKISGLFAGYSLWCTSNWKPPTSKRIEPQHLDKLLLDYTMVFVNCGIDADYEGTGDNHICTMILYRKFKSKWTVLWMDPNHATFDRELVKRMQPIVIPLAERLVGRNEINNIIAYGSIPINLPCEKGICYHHTCLMYSIMAQCSNIKELYKPTNAVEAVHRFVLGINNLLCTSKNKASLNLFPLNFTPKINKSESLILEYLGYRPEL